MRICLLRKKKNGNCNHHTLPAINKHQRGVAMIILKPSISSWTISSKEERPVTVLVTTVNLRPILCQAKSKKRE